MSDTQAAPATPSPNPPARPPVPAHAANHIDFSTTLDERTKAFTVAAALLGLFLAALDQTIVSTAMPKIAQELNGLELYTWVTTAYILASTAMVPIYGKLSDIYGRKVILLTGIVIFVSASALCGASTSMEMLVFVRGLQGVGAAALSSTAFAVVADLYEVRKRAKVQGFFGAVFGLSSVIGPPLGGVLTEHLSWRSVFYVNVPLGIVVVGFIIAKMPALKQGIKASIDWLGSALIIAGTVPLLLALSYDHTKHPWGSQLVVGLLVGGLAALALFVYVESKVSSPVIPLRLFRNAAFSQSILISFLFGGVFFGAIIFIPLFMKMVVGVSDTASGTTLMPLSISLVVAAGVSSQIASRIGRIKPLVVGGLVLVATGYFLLSRMTVETTQLEVTLRMIVLGLGIGPALPLLTLAVQNSVERWDIGTATSSRQFFQQLGSAFGAAILGAVLTTTLGAQMHDRMEPLVTRLPPAMRAQYAAAQPAGGGAPAGEGAMGGGESGPPAAMIQGIEQGFAAKQTFLEAAVLRGDEQAKLKLLSDPTNPPQVTAALQSDEEHRPMTYEAAKASLDQAKASVFAQMKATGAAFKLAKREAFSAAVVELFKWALGLTLITLLCALLMRDQRLTAKRTDAPAPHIEM